MGTLDSLLVSIRSKITINWVLTHEEERFIEQFENEIVKPNNFEILTWNCVTGITGQGESTINPAEAVNTFIGLPSNNKFQILIMKDGHTACPTPVPRMLRENETKFREKRKSVLFLSPRLGHGHGGTEQGIDPVIEKITFVFQFNLPTKTQIEDIMKEYLSIALKQKGDKITTKLKYTPEEIEIYARALQGLTGKEIQNAIITSLMSQKKLDPVYLLDQKKQIVKRSDILEYIDIRPSFSDIGGCDALKKYFIRYKDQFLPEAIEFGIEPLRGVLMTGVPGAGKSLGAKAVAAEWNLPLLRLDVGKVMTGIVGGSIRGSEEVIWFDEQEQSHRNTIKELVELAPENCWMHTYTDEGKSVLRKVAAFIPHQLQISDKMYKLTLEDGRSITTTGDHGVLTHDDQLNLKEIRVDKCTPRDFIAVPNKISYSTNKEPEGTWTEGFLAGAWLGDGDYNGADVRYHLNIQDISDFEEILKTENLNYSIYNNSSSDQCKTIHVRHLQKTMKEIGYIGDCYTKRVPEKVFGFSDEYIRGLITGYISTDGSFNGHVLEASSVSKLLRDDIAHLFNRLGIHVFITEKLSDGGYRIKPGIDYKLEISGETDLLKFEQEIGFFQEYKSQKLINRQNVNPDGYYVPLTQSIKNEINLARKIMWEKLHYRPYNYDYRADSIGLNTLLKCSSFFSTPEEGTTIKNCLRQEIRWIRVKSVIEIPKEQNENIVYDISIPSTGTEKFLAGSCPLLVHNSEQRMREAISQAESIAPACLWLDEIEKGLSGTGSSNMSDSGTLSRVFGTLLVAMEEGMKDIIVIATANDIAALPPELIRRFTEVFFVDLPVKSERKEIFEIHLKKKGRDPEKIDLDTVIEASHNFTGSEIEKAVKDAITRSWHRGRAELSTEDLLSSIRDTKALALVMEDKITAIRDWARARARYASSLAEAEQRPAELSASEMSGNLMEGLT